MKPLIVFVIVLASFASAQAQWKKVETLRYDWVGSGSAATFTLGYDGGGEFTRVRVLTPGNPEFVLSDEDGLTNFRKDTCENKKFGLCTRKNLFPSDRLFFYRLPSGEVLLFVFGWTYASSPGSVHVLALDRNGMPHEMLSLRDFDIDDLIDVDGDGTPEIVGKKCFSQEWGDHLLTYDPYSVYRLPKQSTMQASYSLELSKQYNLKRYYGWAGPNCREDVAVVLHPPGAGKPVIMNSKEAEKLPKHK